MKALILPRLHGPSAAFALLSIALTAIVILVSPILGAALALLVAVILAPKLGAFGARIADVAYRSRVRIVVGAAIFALCVLALLFVGGAAHAADSLTVDLPLPDAVPTSVVGVLAILGGWVVIIGKAAFSAFGVTGVASAASAFLPQGEPGSTWDKTRTVINWLALNVKNARNIVLKG
ncbi:hypothetical protein [Methylocapsa aurea]|uniref:hypothetical protein n=1 Tax=Methylocapsa aurea TaxID=663610 RepID=UPI003D18F3C1